MRPSNGDKVSKLIQEGHDVNAKNSSGLTVIQYAAFRYFSDTKAASGSQELRTQWRQTIQSLSDTNQVRFTKVTKEAWSTSALPPDYYRSVCLATNLRVTKLTFQSDSELHAIPKYASEPKYY
jgi:hypothetical protein